jgi:indoleacetamide hydrolase
MAAGDDAPAALTQLSAVEATAAMRRGELAAEDYAEALLARAARLPQLNAFCTLDPPSVRAAAREADLRRRGSRTLGRLHGLPLPVKDSINTRALPTSNGTRSLAGFRPHEDAPVLAPLFAEGAILMGKTSLHELSCGWTSNNTFSGPVRNPYDLTRTPGGSSGGSAAAVAARIAPLALGEDTYGSIRVPASFCGLVGFRPTHGRYPNDGVMPLSRGRFDQSGPLARCVADVVLFDSVVTGRELAFSPPLLERVRVGFPPGQLTAGIDPECERLLEHALETLTRSGVQIVHAEVPAIFLEASDVERAILHEELLSSMMKYLDAQGASVTLDELIDAASENLKPLLLASRTPGPREAYERALQRRVQIETSAAEYFREHRLDALALPPTLMAAFAQSDAHAVDIAGQRVDLFEAIGRNVAIGSCARLASLVLPIGRTGGGLPFGVELAAPSGADERLLALSLAIERVLGPIEPPAL